MSELGQLALGRRGSARVFRLVGEFDMSNAWEIEHALFDSIERESDDMLVDLSEVRFMDAQLIRVLVKARAAALKRGRAFDVIPPVNPTAGRVAQLIEFDQAA